MTQAVIEISGVVKDYRGLRPLRIGRLRLDAGDQLAILGVDQPAAEVFVNLVTGATLPDSGDIRIFGRPTSSIKDSADWLALVDRFGIVSERAVLLEGLTPIQNIAIPFTLDIEPPPDEVRQRAAGLAAEAGLPETAWSQPVGRLDPGLRVRVRLARALALDPAILLLEHPSAGLAHGDVRTLGRYVRAVSAARGASLIALTADAEFAEAVAARVASHRPATGELSERRRWCSLARTRFT